MTGKTALVVDDSKSARFALRKSLESFSYAVTAAEGAKEAYDYLAGQRPDVIFLDHLMPGTDGFDVLGALRRNAATASIPVIICSSNEAPDFVAQARSKGAVAVLQKPPSPGQLGQLIQELEQGRLVPAPVTAEPLRQTLPSAPSQPSQPTMAPAPVVSPSTQPAHAETAPRPATSAAPASMPRSSAKVSPIREPEVAIEQAVLAAVRQAMPQNPPVPAPAKSPLTAVPARPREDGGADAIGALREQMDARLRKITQDLYGELAEVKSQMAHLDGPVANADGDAARDLAALRAQLADLKEQLDAVVEDFGKRLDETLAAARQAAAEEAHAVAESTVMNAASRISTQLAEGILKVMMSGTR